MGRRTDSGETEEESRGTAGSAAGVGSASSRKATVRGRAAPGMLVRGLRPQVLSPGFSKLGRLIMDRLDRGIALLDADGTVLDGNSPALDILRSGDGLTLRAGRFAFTDAELDARWTRLLAVRSKDAGDSPATIAARVRRTDTSPCHVVIAEVPEGTDVRPVMWYVLIYALGERREIAPGVLSELFGLTRAQAAVAASLYEGRSVEATASRLGLSLNTVRSHLKQIFSKCEVQSQAELMHLLALAPHAF